MKAEKADNDDIGMWKDRYIVWLNSCAGQKKIFNVDMCNVLK
jgi:hypothetical protein